MSKSGFRDEQEWIERGSEGELGREREQMREKGERVKKSWRNPEIGKVDSHYCIIILIHLLYTLQV